MEKYARVLVIIFFLCVANLGLNIYIISKINKLTITNNQASISTPLPTTSAKPQASSEPKNSDLGQIKADVTLIKAELRALRELLGTSKSFEELSKLILGIESNP